jgi:hypothetical protein
MSTEPADRLGIAASTLCAIHCLAGALIAGAPGVASVLFDERIELVLVCAAVLIAAFALGMGFRNHHQTQPLVPAGVALAAFAAARLVHGAAVAEVALSVTGAALLVTAHLMNLRALRREDACCEAAPLTPG